MNVSAQNKSANTDSDYQEVVLPIIQGDDELIILEKVDPDNIEGSFENVPNKADANIQKMNIKLKSFSQTE